MLDCDCMERERERELRDLVSCDLSALFNLSWHAIFTIFVW